MAFMPMIKTRIDKINDELRQKAEVITIDGTKTIPGSLEVGR